MSQHFTPGRVVALATPIVAPLAGALAVWLAELGFDVDQNQLTAIFIAGATIAFGKAALWLKGWQDWEKRQDLGLAALSSDARVEESLAPRSIAAPEGAVAVSVEAPEAEEALDDFEEELLADGFDEEIDDADDELLLDDEDLGLEDEELVATGRE
jgi:hypothetical protein